MFICGATWDRAKVNVFFANNIVHFLGCHYTVSARRHGFLSQNREDAKSRFSGVNGNVKSAQKWHLTGPSIMALEEEEETAFPPQKAEKKRGHGGAGINVASGTLSTWR